MRWLLFLLVLAPSVGTAQSVVLDLPRPTPLSGEPEIMVIRVLDLRADTTTVGEAKVGLFNRRRTVEMDGGTLPALTSYLQALLPEAPGRRPIVVGVEVLYVSEQTTAAAEFGRAEVQLRFFEETSEGLADLGRGQAMVEESALDVTRRHAARMAQALHQAVVTFLSSAPLDREESPVVRTLAELAADTTAAPVSSPSPLAEAAEQSIRSFVSGGPLVGANGVGGRIGYGIRSANAQTWLVPAAFELSVLQTENPDRGIDGVFAAFGGSIQVARRLGQSPAYLQGGLVISSGTETIGSESQFFLGGRLSAEIVRYPTDRGAILGLGVYGSRLFGSALYPRDAGVALTLGRQF